MFLCACMCPFFKPHASLGRPLTIFSLAQVTTAAKEPPAPSSAAAGGDTPANGTPAMAQEAGEASKPGSPAQESPSQPLPEIQQQLVDVSRVLGMSQGVLSSFSSTDECPA